MRYYIVCRACGDQRLLTRFHDGAGWVMDSNVEAMELWSDYHTHPERGEPYDPPFEFLYQNAAGKQGRMALTDHARQWLSSPGQPPESSPASAC